MGLDATAGGGSFPRRGASGAADGGSGGGGWRCGVRIPASVAWWLFKSHGSTLRVSLKKICRAINESYDSCGQRGEHGEETRRRWRRWRADARTGCEEAREGVRKGVREGRGRFMRSIPEGFHVPTYFSIVESEAETYVLGFTC